MLIVSCFKFIFCYSYVCVFLVDVFLYDCGLVNNSFFRDGDFADFSAFADFFSVLPIFRISADFCSSEL